VARYAVRINGLSGIALTKLDVLSGFETIKVCTAYACGDELLTDLPASMEAFANCRPVYEEFPGWCSDIGHVRQFEDLPVNARNYIRKLEELTGCPIMLVSVGPRRDETILLRNPFQ